MSLASLSVVTLTLHLRVNVHHPIKFFNQFVSFLVVILLKGKEFTSSELANLLTLTDKQADFQLNFLSEADGVSYVMVAPFTEKQYTITAPTPPKEEAVATETTEEVVAEANTFSVEQEEVVEEEVDESVELDSAAFEDEDEDEAEKVAETEAAGALDFLED